MDQYVWLTNSDTIHYAFDPEGLLSFLASIRMTSESASSFSSRSIFSTRSFSSLDKYTIALIRRRLRPLLELWHPSVLMINGARGTPIKRNPLREKLVKKVVSEATTHRVRVRIFTSTTMKEITNLTKYERAQAVVERFPILTPKLSQKRKPWESFSQSGCSSPVRSIYHARLKFLRRKYTSAQVTAMKMYVNIRDKSD
jgi:hypothetical protein